MNKTKQLLSVEPQVVQSLINAIPDPVLWISVHGEVLDINEAAEKAWNIKKNLLLGHKLSYTPAPSEAEEHVLYPALARIDDNEYACLILKTERPHSSETQNWDVISHYLLTHSAQDTQNNDQDIYQYMENIIAEIPISVYWMNTEYIYLGCSNDMAKLLRLRSRHDIIGKTYSDLYDEQSGAHYKKADQEVIQKGVSLSVEEPLYQPDGTKEIYLSKKVPLKNAQGTIIGMLGISVNISERIKMEQALENAKKQAEAANAAKTEFIANMSHDIRTPLTGVIGLSEILEQTLKDPLDREKAHMLHNSGEELLHMLNDILDDVRAGNLRETDLKTESFDLHQCIHDLIRLETPATSLKHLTLKARIAPNVPRYIRSDRNKIHRILLNLLGNAIKFTQSGCITLSIECLHLDKSTVHLKLGVSDTGIGIPEEVQSQVFQRFFKVSSSYKEIYTGHGLGLHIVQSYVTLLGGHITLTSKVGEGTSFHFDVQCPLGEAPAIKKEQAAPSPPSKSLSKKAHLLLVEDNVIALKTLEMMLSLEGYSFISATTGEDAWTLLQTNPVDLIITDIGLPGISGTQLSTRIRNKERALNKPITPIIGLTGHAKETAWEECLRAGMNDVLSKPASINVLEQCIHRIINPAPHVPKNDPSSDKLPSLGTGLPKTEEELFQLDAFALFDEQRALSHIPDLNLLATLLNTYLSDEIQKDIHQMKTEYQHLNWQKIEELAHKIKGGVNYLGTLKMSYACQYLERYYKEGHRSLLEPLYQQLIKVNEETIEALTRWLNR